MPKLIDLTGRRFGRLTVVERVGTKYEEVTWSCACDCGNEVVVSGKELRRGRSKSCGCLLRESTSARFLKHGATKDDKSTSGYRLYAIWRGMLDRCYLRSGKAFPRYGGAGISVCAEWHRFEAFRRWAMSNGYDASLTLDRKDNQIGYTPENCHWATPLEQTENRRITRRLTYQGQTKTFREWADDAHIPYEVFRRRINAGWPIERALTEPVKKK